MCGVEQCEACTPCRHAIVRAWRESCAEAELRHGAVGRAGRVTQKQPRLLRCQQAHRFPELSFLRREMPLGAFRLHALRDMRRTRRRLPGLHASSDSAFDCSTVCPEAPSGSGGGCVHVFSSAMET
jgi:hypothetical protein